MITALPCDEKTSILSGCLGILQYDHPAHTQNLIQSLGSSLPQGGCVDAEGTTHPPAWVTCASSLSKSSSAVLSIPARGPQNTSYKHTVFVLRTQTVKLQIKTLHISHHRHVCSWFPLTGPAVVPILKFKNLFPEPGVEERRNEHTALFFLAAVVWLLVGNHLTVLPPHTGSTLRKETSRWKVVRVVFT